MGLNQAMNVAIRGMAASKLGLDITSQNISNVNTKGYSRKKLTLTSESRRDEQFGQMGFGVEVENIQRSRDVFIDEQIQEQLHTKGYFSEIREALERIENIYTEPQKVGLSDGLDQFWNAWQDLANNPSDYGARSVVQSKGQGLVETMHNLGQELQSLQASRNTSIINKVKDVNKILEEVYNLNKEITTVEVNNQNANDSRDRRDQLLKELSEYVDVDVIENKYGSVSVTSAGYLLVSPINFSKIEPYSKTYKNTDGTTRLDYGLRVGESKKDYVPKDGEIKGLFTVRDEIVPEYINKIDELAAGLVEHVNRLHVNGYDTNGFTGINFFDPNKTKAAEIELSAAVKQSPIYIAAATGGTSVNGTYSLPSGSVGSSATAPGVANPHYMYGTPIQLPDNDFMQGSVTVTTNNGTVQLEEGNGKDYVVDYKNGTITFLSTALVKIGTPNNTSPISISYKYNSGASKGTGDGSNAMAIAQLSQTLTMNAKNPYNEPEEREYTGTFGEFYGGMMGTLGIQRNEAEANVESRSYLVRYLEKQQDAIAGVSLDEEMANLIKYEHSFAASARLIAVVERMMDTLIKM